MWPTIPGPDVVGGAPTHYWRGGFFDFGGFDPKRSIERARLVDQSQEVDPLYNPALMVDLSQGFDLSRGFDPSRVQSGARPRAFLPGPGLVGLYGLFEGDFVGAPESPPRRRGLLMLGRKKKAWKPRRLRGWRWPSS